MSEPTPAGPATGLEIAIIGMACRFPGARNLDEFWRNLREGVESITYLTEEQLDAAGEPPELYRLPNYVRVARTIEGDDLFDAGLFGLSPREAELIDPQQRMFLECGWQALEHAGYDSERFDGLVGVYAGIKLTGYVWNIYSNKAVLAAAGELNAQIANDKDYVATRLSYKLGLGGPSMTVQSACSTSLVAVHLGCQALLSGECDMALAGGVSVRTVQNTGYTYREGDILSPDGHCRAFDAGARGTIFGNGLGIVVLRRLDDALAAGDHVYAVLKGSAVNNDSSVKVGFTAPGAAGQERVIRAAHAVSGVPPETISYIEAHGTGTQVGDPIEMTALTRAFRAATQKKGFCAIGSVKTNIGHLASAAGVAGLIKTVLALEHRQIPPSLLFERPNPQIELEGTPFYVATELAEWRANGHPRRAGVSAFGIGGTNAHAILEEAPPRPASGPSRPWQLLVLSAKTETALEQATAELAAHLESRPEGDLPEAAFTLQVGRRLLEHRRFLVCRGAADAVGALRACDPARLLGRASAARRPPVAFLLSGQGSQHVGMLAQLHAEEEVFRRELDHAAELLLPALGLDLRGVLYPPAGGGEEAEWRLAETWLAQPALFAVEHALARQWMEWGVRPEAMLGHSIGEYVAACLAGVFTLAEGLALVAARGRLMQAMPPGAMLTVSLPEAEVEPLLGRQLSLAAVNAPRRCVVSGPEEAVAALAAELEARGVGCRRLHTSHAFHSQMMEPILAPFLAEVGRVALKPPQLPFLSNLSGGWIGDAEATDPGYWARHLRGTVRFEGGLRELLREPQRVLLEVGPGQSLATLARQHGERTPEHVVVASARHPQETASDQATLLAALGHLWSAGVDVDWRGFYAGERRRRVALPTYPFERRRYWIEAGADTPAAAEAQALRRKQLADWFYVPLWRPSAPPVPAEGEAPLRWLVFADEAGIAQELAARLRPGAEDVALALAGPEFAARGDGVYELSPGRAEDYDALLAAFAAAGGVPQRIVHCWNLGGDEPEVAERGALCRRAHERGFLSLLFLAQALGRQKIEGKASLVVVSSGVQRLPADGASTPEKAVLLGPVKVMAQEYPQLDCRSVDLAASELAASRGELVGLLADELSAATDDLVVAYRGGARWVEGYQPVPLDRVVESRLPLRERGVYLITGGLGGIGLELAAELVRRTRARLVLAGLTALPPRDDWPALLAGQSGTELQRDRVRKVQELEEQGGEVLVAKVNVTDLGETRAMVEEARARFGAIHGVIHAAGVPGGGMMQIKTAKAAGNVIAPKVQGTLALAEALADVPLDFLVLCSSTIAVLGNFGQVDYCAANNFLDAFAREHAAATGARTVSINWGAWKEVGMAANTLVPSHLLAAQRADQEPGAAAAPAGELVHPLLGRLTADGDERKVFTHTLTADLSWVLAEHRVMQTSALPGTAYLEMARAAFEHAFGAGPVELRDVFFLSPLMVGESEARESRVVLEREPKREGWSFKVLSRRAGGAGAEWQEHALGRLAPAPAALEPPADLAALRARCASERMEISERMLDNRENLVFWGEHWQSLKWVEIGDGEALAFLELPGELQGDSAALLLHPALLDVATAIVGLLDRDSFLPLSYHRVRVHGALPPRLLSHVRRRDAGGGETITADVTLLAEDGARLVEIEGFAMKRVGAAAQKLQQAAGAQAAPAMSAGAPAGGAGRGLFAEGGMLSAEGVEAFLRILSRSPGPQVAVSPRDLDRLLEQVAKSRRESLVGDLSKLGTPRTAHPRPSVQTPFEAPRDELETALAGVWQDVLGIETVGVHDNFYDLGGDSVLGIQILARARDAGVELTSNQLFQFQTVAALAEELRGAEAPVAEAPAAPAESREGAPASDGVARLLAEHDGEDAYPLAPLQQALLVHAIDNPRSGFYCEQVTFWLDIEVDPELVRRAWQSVVDRHPILRTSFVWQGVEEPLQLVHRRAELSVERLDWSGVEAQEQEERLAALRRGDRRRNFDVSREPLLRLTLVRLGDERWLLLVSYHHLLLDGWSVPIVGGEAFFIYEALAAGREVELPLPRPYRAYIDWLARQDLVEAEVYWRRTFAGFTHPTPLGGTPLADGEATTEASFEAVRGVLSAEQMERLRDLARGCRVTLNALVQAAWCLVLARASGEPEVVFGVSVSGRPAELEGVARMVGLFVNTLPMRVALLAESRLADWLGELHGKQLELSRFEHTPLTAVQAASGLARGVALFESVLSYANYPVAWRQERGDERFLYESRNQFPLCLTVVPRTDLSLELVHDSRRFDGATATLLLERMEAALLALTAAPEATLGELLSGLEEDERRRRAKRAERAEGVARAKLKRRAARREAVEG